MARVEVDQVTGREHHYPETILERIAWALCARHSQSREGYLQDDELEGVEALLQAMARRCGNERAEADFLGVPLPSVRRYLPALKMLARSERRRRDDDFDGCAALHLTMAYWQDYLPEAKAAFAVAIEDARVAQPALSQADKSA